MKKVLIPFLLGSLFALASCSPDEDITKKGPVELSINAITHDVYEGRKLTLACSKKAGVTFSSSNTEVATVDEKGVVKAVSKGKATIQAKDADGSEAKFEINVSSLPTDLKGMFAAAKTYNFTIPYSDSSYAYLDAYNVVRVPATSILPGASTTTAPLTGILQNGEQGLASFSFENNAIIIGDFYGLGKVKSALDVYGDSFTPFFTRTSDWSPVSEGDDTSFKTTKQSLINSFASMMGMDYYISYIDSVNLTVDYSKMSLYYSTTLSNETYGFYINRIGITANTKIEPYIAAPTPLKARQDWDETDQEKIKKNFDIAKIPFLEGSGYSLSLQAYENKLSISDYNGGDLSESYVKKLTELGWVDEGKKDSHMGYDEQSLVYNLPKESKYDGEQKYTASITYLPKDILNGKDVDAFPNGKFEVVFTFNKKSYTDTSENEDNLNAYLKDKGEGKFPAIALNGLANKVEFEDVLDLNNDSVKIGIEQGLLTEDDYYTFACYVTLTIKNESDANTILNEYVSLLKKQGLLYSEEYSSPAKGYFVYLKDRLEFSARIGREDDNKTYSKKLTFFFEF